MKDRGCHFTYASPLSSQSPHPSTSTTSVIMYSSSFAQGPEDSSTGRMKLRFLPQYPITESPFPFCKLLFKKKNLHNKKERKKMSYRSIISSISIISILD